MLKDLGYPIDAIALIGNIYLQSTATFTREHFKKSLYISIQQATIQNDTLSPFIVFLDFFLRWIQQVNNGYTFGISNIQISFAA